MKKMTLAFGVLVLSLPTLAVAKSAEKYSATVQDGTAQVIRPGRVATPEPAEEFLEDLAPAPKKTPAKAKLAAPTNLKVKTPLEARLGEREMIGQKHHVDAVEPSDSAEATPPGDVPVPASETAPVAAPGSDDELPALFPADGVEMTSDEADESTARTSLSKQSPETFQAPVNPTKPVEKRISEKAAVKKTEREKFDVVPDERVSEIAQRLKYANEILKRWGRAYDYRTTTLKEFKKVVAELEAIEEKSEATN